MLEDQVHVKNDSWAIRWYASGFLKGKLTLYPGKSLIHNIGIDTSGIHCGTSNIYDTEINLKPIKIANIPVEENMAARDAIKDYFLRSSPSVARMALDSINRILRR
jgi:hypothetical protein